MRLSKGVALIVVLGLVAACGLPRSGPNKAEIFSGSVLREGDAFVLVVDDRVNAIAAVAPRLGFSSAFLNAGEIGSDTIRPGDVLGLTIWENVEDGLLVPVGQNATILDEPALTPSASVAPMSTLFWRRDPPLAPPKRGTGVVP